MTTQQNDRRPAAALVLRHPTRPLTHSIVQEALAPLAALLDLDPADTISVTITDREVRVHLIPRFRGKRLTSARVRAVWPIALDPASTDD